MSVENAALTCWRFCFNWVIYTLGIRHKEKDLSVVVEHRFECQKILRGLGNKSHSVQKYSMYCDMLRTVH